METSIRITDADTTDAKAPEEIHNVDIQWNYIPQGLTLQEEEPWKLLSEEHPYQGGISAASILMDRDLNLSEAVYDYSVVYSEDTSVNGHDAVYMEFARTNEGWGYDKQMYIVYPEVWHILELYGSTDVSREEFLKTADGIELVETDEILDLANEKIPTWSEIANPDVDFVMDDTIIWGIDRSRMNNLHQIGDFMDFSTLAEFDGDFLETTGLKFRVTDVQVADDLSLLTSQEDIPENWLEQTDENGKLREEERRYIKYGDGVDTLDEIVDTETVSQKLVYVTKEFTNTSEETYTNVLYYLPMIYLKETDGMLRLIEKPEDDIWDYVAHTGAGGSNEMYYHDVHPEPGTTNGGNYIPSLAPGETVTVHLAWIVDEDELDTLYLSLDPSAYTITERALEIGYVNLRQS